MKQIKSLFVFFISLLALQSSFVQLLADAKMTDATKALIKKIDEAVGTEKLKNAKSLQVKSKMEIPDANISGTTEIISLNDKAYQKANFAGNEQISGYDGKVAWGKDLMQGTRELKGQEKEMIVQTTLGVMKNPIGYYTEIVQEKDEQFQEKDCFVLIYKKEGIPDRKTFIQKSNHLPLGMIDISDTPQGKITLTTHIVSYKKSSVGFLVPEKIILDMGVMKMNITVSEIKLDGEVDEKIFKQPE